VRECGGPGRSGKTASILDFIDNYWDAIEKDFAGKGFDARDWIRGIKPWDQFYNYCDMFSNTEGSWLQEAQSLDDRHLAEWEQLYEKALRAKRIRPRLAGYDALRSEIREIHNTIRGYMQMPRLDGPATPMDVIKERKKTIGDRRLDSVLGYED
jgi:hypothetical protein